MVDVLLKLNNVGGKLFSSATKVLPKQQVQTIFS